MAAIGECFLLASSALWLLVRSQRELPPSIANYALCPHVTIGEIVRQMRALVSWTYRHIAEFNGDPENIHVGGHSAGGHLAAMMALTDWRGAYGLSPNIVKTIFPISGLYDLEPLRHSYLQPDLRLDDREIETHSPQRHVRRVHPPMLLSYGSEEPSEFSRQSDDFLSAWKRAGNRATYLPQIGRNHFTAIADFTDKDSPFCRELFALMGHTPRPQSAFGDRPAASVLIPSSGFGLSSR